MIEAAHPTECTPAKREEIGIVAPERRILLTVFWMMAGIVSLYQFPAVDPFILFGGGAGCLLICAAAAWVILPRRSLMRSSTRPSMRPLMRPSTRTTRASLVLVSCAAFLVGWSSAGWQLHNSPAAQVTAPTTIDITGQVIAIDGQIDKRSRLWVRIDKAAHRSLRIQSEQAIVRLAVKDPVGAAQVGQIIAVTARLFPPQGPVFPGAIDYGFQARIKGVVASGYSTGPVRHISGAQLAPTWPHNVNAYRYGVSAWLAAQMGPREGGIAAALLVGDRRYVSDEIYAQFRRAGLAHLLAISGLHMGLVCFGVIAVIRLLFACFPQFAVHIPVHKYSAIIGIIVTCGYVMISGGATSAIRAFFMALLVVVALVSDRVAITIRNVALAAVAILLVNPGALLTAGFQLSFAATTLLVLWFERNRSHPHVTGLVWPLRDVKTLLTMSLLAGLATAPFAAQHFGSLTPWGVVANVLAIPLTAVWIMPAGVLVMLLQAAPSEVAAIALGVMQQGLILLIDISAFFPSLPGAGFRVPQPGYGVMSLGLCGWLLMALAPKSWRHRAVGSLVIGIAAALWATTKPADIAMIARDRPAAVITATATDTGIGTGTGTGTGTAIIHAEQFW